MTRDEALEEVLAIQAKNILLELPTGFGKSALALKLAEKYSPDKILVVVNRTVHVNTWRAEIEKWYKNKDTQFFYFTTYASLHKHTGNYKCVIFDECHHLSNRCIHILRSGYNIEYSILLSATVKKELKSLLKIVFPGLEIYSKSLRNAVEEDILPDPKVYLIPMILDNSEITETITYNPKGKSLIVCDYKDRWRVRKDPKYKKHIIKVRCTKRQYLTELNSQIEYWKNRYMSSRSTISRNKWLRLCMDRLIWLSDKKRHMIYKLLSLTTDKRTLTFCNSVKQTEDYGRYCINSKNKSSAKYLEDFNNHKIHHITACNVLNEGVNLKDCQIGIFANLNNSEIITRQRIGRLLRHKNPILIIPYYKDSREEDLVKKMIENCNPELVETITDLNEMKL